jgi:hypothetical protein
MGFHFGAEPHSVNRNEACAFCHMPYTGFTGPIPSLNRTTVAYPGSFHYRFGKRKPQSYTYSPHYPVLQYNTTAPRSIAPRDALRSGYCAHLDDLQPGLNDRLSREAAITIERKRVEQWQLTSNLICLTINLRTKFTFRV